MRFSSAGYAGLSFSSSGRAVRQDRIRRYGDVYNMYTKYNTVTSCIIIYGYRRV